MKNNLNKIKKFWSKITLGSEILDTISKYSILLIAFTYIYTYPDTQKKEKESLILQSWQIINSRTEKSGNGGVNKALKTLVEYNESLKHIQFNNIYISGLKLYSVDFERSFFRNSIIENSEFIKSNFAQSDFTNAILRENNFSNSNFSSYYKKEVSMGIINKKKGYTTNFSNADLSNSDFSNCDLTGAKFHKTIFDYVTFDYANLESINFNNAKFCETSFKHTKLIKAKFKSADFRVSSLGMKPVSLEYSDLRKADFQGANLSNSRTNNVLVFVGLALASSDDHEKVKKDYRLDEGVSLKGAKIAGTNFSYSDLNGTDFTDVVYRKTNFWGKINFSSTNLTGVKGVTQSLLDNSCGNEETILPTGYTIIGCNASNKSKESIKKPQTAF